jgi:hypothetical protein
MSRPFTTLVAISIVLSIHVAAQIAPQPVLKNPTNTQTIIQPAGTVLNANTMENVSFSDQFNWSQTPSVALTAGVQATVTLTPCPLGIDASGASLNPASQVDVGYYITINSGTEADLVQSGGTCTPGLATGSIKFTPQASYTGGSYTIGSASAGIQEAVNNACGPTQPPASGFKNDSCTVVVPASGNEISGPTGYNVYGTIYVHTTHMRISGYGATVSCSTRGPCMQLGDLSNSNDYTNITVEGLHFRAPTNFSTIAAYAGSAITATQTTGSGCSPCLVTITAPAHGFQVGDMVAIMATDDHAYWGDAVITGVTTNTFSYLHGSSAVLPQSTPGFVALEYCAILDNALSSRLMDLAVSLTSNNGAFNNVFDIWDDENALIDHFNNNGIPPWKSANWAGSIIFSAGNQFGHQLAPVITLQSSIITNTPAGVTDFNNNGLYLLNNVIENHALWQVSSSNIEGNFQGTYIQNLYPESAIASNNTGTPWAGTGVAGLVEGPSSTVTAVYTYTGNGSPLGAISTQGSGSPTFEYYVVAHDTTAVLTTNPMWVAEAKGTGFTIRWPRISLDTHSITYDLLRTTGPATGVGFQAPSYLACTGGSPTSCGSVAINQTQCSGLVCQFVDTVASTSNYVWPATNTIGYFKPNLVFWPGGVVMTDHTLITNHDTTSSVVNVGNGGNPVEVAEFCQNFGFASSFSWIECLGSYTTPNNSVPNQTGLLLTDGSQAGGGQSWAKGRLDFVSTPFISPVAHNIITLIDSNPSKTEGTIGYRPSADQADVWIGSDQTSGGLTNGALALGSPTSISGYINSLNGGDGTSSRGSRMPGSL